MIVVRTDIVVIEVQIEQGIGSEIQEEEHMIEIDARMIGTAILEKDRLVETGIGIKKYQLIYINLPRIKLLLKTKHLLSNYERNVLH